ncbi:MAG: hypothetical protein AB1442_14160, partial [Nitrospirota bacterium]
RIKTVGFVVDRNGVERPVSLRKTRAEINKELRSTNTDLIDSTVEVFSYIGILTHADTPIGGRYGTVWLIERITNKKRVIKVPTSIMKDVVQPFYEELVLIQGYKKDDKLYLEEIELGSYD